jgi:hypothetical protein
MMRYTVSGSAGVRDGKRFAVLDTQDKQGGKGMRRVAFFRTAKAAQAHARRLNREEVAQATWLRQALSDLADRLSDLEERRRSR